MLMEGTFAVNVAKNFKQDLDSKNTLTLDVAMTNFNVQNAKWFLTPARRSFNTLLHFIPQEKSGIAHCAIQNSWAQRQWLIMSKEDIPNIKRICINFYRPNIPKPAAKCVHNVMRSLNLEPKCLNIIPSSIQKHQFTIVQFVENIT